MVRRRAPCIEVDGLNKGTWTAEEDAKLAAYVLKHGHDNWRTLPKLAGLKRCGKSCRLRWINYLSPDVKRGKFTKDEEEIVIRLHPLLGNKWSKIASCLPGRTDNEIKNMWHTNLKKRVQDAAGKSSSSAHIKTRRVTQAACGTTDAFAPAAAANVAGDAAGLNEELLTPSKTSWCRSYATGLGTKESTERCMEQGRSQQTLSSDHELNCAAMESCVTSPEPLHVQPWPLQPQQHNVYDHTVTLQDDGYFQLMEIYSLSVDPEEVWRYMEDDDYLQLPPVVPDPVPIDSVLSGAVDGCSNIIDFPAGWSDQEQASTSSRSGTWDADRDRWWEYLEKELDL